MQCTLRDLVNKSGNTLFMSRRFKSGGDTTKLAQGRCGNVVTTSLLTLSQRCGTVENESCFNVSFQRRDNVVVRRCQDVAKTSPQH